MQERTTRPRKPFPVWEEPLEPLEPQQPGMPQVHVSDKEFAEAERLGKVQLNLQIRKNLHDAIELAAGWAEPTPRRPAIDRKLKEIREFAQSLAVTERHLRAVEARSIPGVGRFLLELWRAKLPDSAALPTEYYDLHPMAHRLLNGLKETAEEAIEKLKKLRQEASPRGAPKKFQHLDSFIRILAENFARAGGVPSAAWQPVPSTRNTRFLRFLRFFHAKLPPAMQATNPDALDERADKVITEMKAWRQERGFPQWHKAKGRKSTNRKR